MAFFDFLKVSRKTFFDPQNWLGADFVKTSNSLLVRAFRAVFRREPTAPDREETFEQAMERMEISSQDLNSITQVYLIFTILLSILGFLLIALGLYFWAKLYIADGVIAISISAFVFSQAFRFDFWRFQIKHRKLGCTFEEWRQGKTYEEGPPL